MSRTLLFAESQSAATALSNLFLVLPVNSSAFPRCAHSVFLASEEEVKSGRAYFCSLCRPQSYELPGVPDSPLTFVMPRFASACDSERERTNIDPTACPQCQSQFKFRTAKRCETECAECHTIYKAKL